MEMAKANQHIHVRLPESGIRKTEFLANAGIDIRRANETEKLETIPDDEFLQIIEQKRERRSTAFKST